MKHYNWCLRSYILVMLLRDVQPTVGRESAMLQMPWMVLFEFLGCNKNILHSYSTFLQKTSWVLNKLVSFITAFKVETKKTDRWNWPYWGMRHISKELWNIKLLLISWALVTVSAHLYWPSCEAAQLKSFCLGGDRTTNVNIVVVSNLQPVVTPLAKLRHSDETSARDSGHAQLSSLAI